MHRLRLREACGTTDPVVHLHIVARFLHVDRSVLAGSLGRLADWIYLTHLNDLRLPLGLARPVPATGQALVLVIGVGLSPIILLILSVKDLLLVGLERSVARRVNLICDKRLHITVPHSVHVLLSSKLILVVATQLLLLCLSHF